VIDSRELNQKILNHELVSIRADILIVNASLLLKNHFLLIKNKRIFKILSESEYFQNFTKVSYYYQKNSVISTGFVNCHTHIELSFFNQKPDHTSFTEWISSIVADRNNYSIKEQKTAGFKAIENTMNHGTIAFGDISNSGILIKECLEKYPHIKHFIEVLSLQESRADKTYADCIEKFADLLENENVSLSPHAIYSVSKTLLSKLKNKNRLQSIHVDESESERQFLNQLTGEIRSFLETINVWDHSFNAYDSSPYAYIDQFGYLENCLLVHNLQLSNNDIKLLKVKKSKIVVCPRSNMYLHHKLPNISLMLKEGLEPALGTDSLASCDDLSILNEMKFLRYNYPELLNEEIYRMGTEYGAKHLSFNDLGSIELGKKAICNYFTFEVLSADPLSDLLNKDYLSLTVFGI
jgi:aminodeoxyfutalosine deaminase